MENTKIKKQVAFLELLSEGLVEMYLNKDSQGVVLPKHLMDGTDPVVHLDYGYNLPIPITDFNVTEEGVSAVMSFYRTPTYTFIPWTAVFLIRMIDGEEKGYFDPSAVPKTVNELFEATAPLSPRSQATRKLGLVSLPPEKAETSEEGEVSEEQPVERVFSGLKSVK